MSYYCTTFCNQGHSLKTGKPLNHECYILPPKALASERSGLLDQALDQIQAAKPLAVHAGTRCRHRWRVTTTYNTQGWVTDQATLCVRCAQLQG